MSDRTPDDDGRAVLCIVALDSRFIGRTPVDDDRLRDAVAADGLRQKAFCGLLIALFGQQEIDGLAGLLHA